jgi:hypothetical protein
LLQTVRQRAGLTHTELRLSESHNIKAERFDKAIASLLKDKLIIAVETFDKRQATCYYPAPIPVSYNPNSLIPTNSHIPIVIQDADVQEPNSLIPTNSHIPITLSNLIDWGNANGIRWRYNDDLLLYWATPANVPVPPSVADAIRSNQDTLAMIAEAKPLAEEYCDVVIEDAGDELIDDADPWVRELRDILHNGISLGGDSGYDLSHTLTE